MGGGQGGLLALVHRLLRGHLPLDVRLNPRQDCGL